MDNEQLLERVIELCNIIVAKIASGAGFVHDDKALEDKIKITLIKNFNVDDGSILTNRTTIKISEDKDIVKFEIVKETYTKDRIVSNITFGGDKATIKASGIKIDLTSDKFIEMQDVVKEKLKFLKDKNTNSLLTKIADWQK